MLLVCFGLGCTVFAGVSCSLSLDHPHLPSLTLPMLPQISHRHSFSEVLFLSPTPLFPICHTPIPPHPILPPYLHLHRILFFSAAVEFREYIVLIGAFVFLIVSFFFFLFLVSSFVDSVLLSAAVELREYPVLIGAVAATLTELYEPLGLNDNLTIPLFSSLAMQWGFARIQACEVPHLRDIAADFRGQYSLHIPSFVYNAPFVGRLADGVGGLLGDAVGLIADYL